MVLWHVKDQTLTEKKNKTKKYIGARHRWITGNGDVLIWYMKYHHRDKTESNNQSALCIYDWLFVCLLVCLFVCFIVLRPAQEFLTYMVTSLLILKGCKILAYSRRSVPLSREVSLSCYTCCDTGPGFLWSPLKDRLIQSPLPTRKGVWRIHFNPDPRWVSQPDMYSIHSIWSNNQVNKAIRGQNQPTKNWLTTDIKHIRRDYSQSKVVSNISDRI
jgi:hypothetical protein